MKTPRCTLAIAMFGLCVPTAALGQGPGAPSALLPPDPNATHLFFGPTARALPRGQVNVMMNQAVLWTLQAGVTDRFSVGAGGLPMPFTPIWVTPKVQLHSGSRAAVAAGALHVFMRGLGPDIGIAYGNATIGKRDSALTAGVGYAYTNRPGQNGAAVALIGGEHRMSSRIKLITENYLWRGGGLVSWGVRRVRGRLSEDLGVVVVRLGDESFSAPYVNFVFAIR